MKIILTEDQVKLIKLIKENLEFADKSKVQIKAIKENLDKIYNIISFTTIAEIRDGDIDMSLIERKIEELDSIITNISRNVSNYFDRFDEETYYAKKMDDVHGELEGRITTVNKKIIGLSHIVSQLKPFSKNDDGGDNDWDAPFDNITPTKI